MCWLLILIFGFLAWERVPIIGATICSILQPALYVVERRQNSSKAME
jgi:hypothetical protein